MNEGTYNVVRLVRWPQAVGMGPVIWFLVKPLWIDDEDDLYHVCLDMSLTRTQV